MEAGSSFNLKLLINEIIYRRVFVVIVFALITFVLVSIGLNWPKQFVSSTTIFVEEENILGPLMAGAAVQTEVTDRASIAREIIFGHNIMYQLLELEGLVEDNPNPIIQERLMNDIKGRLNISNVRSNLIKIVFSDKDPDRSYRITDNLARLFIEESLNDKAQQSTEAFEFIDKQAQEYKEKLQSAEAELKKFRSTNIDVQSQMSDQLGRRSSELKTRREQIIQELKEASIRKSSLQKQLSGEAKAASAFSRSEQNKTRIADLQGNLDKLRLSYHETYPDIVQVKTQIKNLRDAVKESESQALSNPGEKTADIDERVLSNPIYQQLQRDLYDTKTNIETLNARLKHTTNAIGQQLEQARNVEEFSARLKELTRDYDVNDESYTDLMRRREQARVSMNLDIEGKGLSLRVDEPAYRPHSPSGMRFLHFLLMGPLVGLVVPIGMIFLIVQFNPVIRSEDDIQKSMGIPVLGSIPHLSTPVEMRKEVMGTVSIAVIFILSIAFVITMGILRMQGSV